ncbi:hypothetical protein Syun_029872 [Stephania yunnanensis]|uniref:Cytochrome b/b6 N-terminal region profile domain-containing protein n=1 Tax=Stephania yunnanensis TaxID=152371 RepID=A0AAP0HGF3_9MAGN
MHGKIVASIMVLMMILYVFRAYLIGRLKKPRKLTWVTGVVLAVLTASFGVTDYSLPGEQIGYWAVKIVTGVPKAVPVIGLPLVELLRGSASVGQSTLTRKQAIRLGDCEIAEAWFDQAAEYWKQAIALTSGGQEKNKPGSYVMLADSGALLVSPVTVGMAQAHIYRLGPSPSLLVHEHIA